MVKNIIGICLITLTICECAFAQLGEGKLYYAITGLDEKLYISSSASGDPGTFAFVNADGDRTGVSTLAPAVASINGKLYYAITGLDEKLYIASSTSGIPGSFAFANADGDRGGVSTNAPALASFNGKIYYAIAGLDQKLYIASSASGRPGSFTFVKVDGDGIGLSTHTPAMTSFNGKLYYAITGLDSKLYIASSISGEPGSFTFAKVDGDGVGFSTLAPAMASFNGKIYYAITGLDSKLYIASSTTGEPGSFTFAKLDGDGLGLSILAPAMSSFNGKLYFAITGVDKKLYIASSTSGDPGTFTFANMDGDRGGVSNFGPAMAGNPPPTEFTNNVYFLGDSVTAGFGFCGSEVTGIVSDCNVNEMFSDAWVAKPWSLNYCSPPKIPDDRCSNNNWSKGKPWNVASWVAGPRSPTVSYSYAVAANQSVGDAANVYNWAITGSEPRHWDPTPETSDPQAGLFSAPLKDLQKSHVVMTLGANPLLADYLDVSVAGYINLTKGKCADSVITTEGGKKIAAPLHDKAGTNGDNIAGVAHCFLQQWNADKQAMHLKNVYEALLKNGNRVIVMGYPYVCPWSFGDWQPSPNIAYGPAKGNACSSESLPASKHYPNANGGNPPITQEQQAFYLNEYANGLIQTVVNGMDNLDIVFVPPAAEWKSNQQPQENAWVFPNDTWVHPSVLGHKQMAKAVETSMCALFQHWCPTPGDPNGKVSWGDNTP